MGEWLGWVNREWFNGVQTLGIVGGLALAAIAARRESKARRIEDYLTLAGQHRELWTDAHARPDLARIFHRELDLVATPITVAEMEFLNLVIVHFHTGWLLGNQGGLLRLDVLSADAKDFFSLPLPRKVWEETRHFRDPGFVHFIEGSRMPKNRKSTRLIRRK